MITVFGEIGFGRDERFQRLRDAFFDQNRLAVQPLHGHVRQFIGDRLAQDGVGAIFVIFVRSAEFNRDVRMLLVKFFHDFGVGLFEQTGVRIRELDLDLVAIGRHGTRDKGRDDTRRGKFEQGFHSFISRSGT